MSARPRLSIFVHDLADNPIGRAIPIASALAKDYEGRVRVGKCDIDANPDFSAQYDIRSIPTLLVFKEGKVVGQIVGAAPKTKIEDLMKKAL